MRLLIGLLLSCLWPAALLVGQEGNLVFHHLTAKENLSELTNVFVYKDSRGLVWISSINGLNRFDGIRIKAYLPDPQDSTSLFGGNIQSSFFEDHHSRIWFSTYDGINVYDRRTDQFRHYLLHHENGTPIVGYHIFHLDPVGRLWIVVQNRFIYTLDCQKLLFQVVCTLSSVCDRALLVTHGQDSHRVVGYQQYSVGVEMVYLDSDYQVTADTVLGQTKTHPLTPSKIISEGDTVLWMTGYDELVRIRLRDMSVRRIPVYGIRTLENLDDHTLLLAVGEEGVWEFDKTRLEKGATYAPRQNNPNSLLTGKIHFISRDRDNGFWFSSMGFGLSFAYPAKKKFWLIHPLPGAAPIPENFEPNSFCSYRDSLVLCATYYQGVYLLNQKGEITSQVPGADQVATENLANMYSLLKDREQNVWFGTYQGMCLLPAGEREIRAAPASPFIPLDGVQLSDGRVLFSALGGGLYQLRFGEPGLQISTLALVPADKGFSTIWQDPKGRVWMHENLQKFWIADPATWTKIKEVGVSGRCAMPMASPDQKWVWMASASGLYKFSMGDIMLEKFYNQLNGLPFFGFTNLIYGQDSTLWLTAKQGVLNFDPATEHVKLYKTADGLPPAEFLPNSAYRWPDGTIWFGSMSGIVSFHPGSLHDMTVEAVPEIMDLLINDQAPSRKLACDLSGNTHITEIRQLTFPYRENTLSFRVNALEYSSPEDNKISYRMEGVDGDWVQGTSGSLARYPNLPPGHYLFKVMAANSDGIFNEQVKTLRIIIIPPFYRTWWFIVLSVLLLLGVIALMLYLRISKTLEIQKMRLRVYENLHDDVGSRLTAIVLTADDLSRQLSTPIPKLEMIVQLSKSIVGNMRRLVWAIDPGYDTIGSLVQKMRQDQGQLIPDTIHTSIELDEKLASKFISGEMRYQLNSIFNEALINSYKYAQASNIQSAIRQEGGSLILTIRDDGIGIDSPVREQKAAGSGYGLLNMQRRVSRIKGVFTIESGKDKGTEIRICVPWP